MKKLFIVFFIGITTSVVAQNMYLGHEYVDLALPSGTLWATCNLGAYSPEQYGSYYAWGEIYGKDNYSWETYKYYDGSYYDESDNETYPTVNKYNIVTDEKGILESSDDAARMNWGGNWRMPTVAEQKELIDNCTWEWTTLQGIKGYKVIGKNGKHIFLPAAGGRTGYTRDNVGVKGCYWSTALDDFLILPSVWQLNSLIAHLLIFDNTEQTTFSIIRSDGHSIRPVCSADAVPKPPMCILNVRENNSTMGKVSGGGKIYKAGYYKIQARPYRGHKFVRWSDGNTDNPRIVQVTKDATYIAEFVPCQYQIFLRAQNGTVTGAESGAQYTFGTRLTLTAKANDGYVFVNWTDSENNIVSGIRTLNVKVKASTIYTANFMEGVDLGLPSGVLWAPFNLGATTSEEYGDYIAWGKLEECSTCRIEYDIPDSSLSIAEDAANAQWGGNWRIPTKEDFEELLKFCSWTRDTINYVNGYRVEGQNGAYIFLPAAGQRTPDSRLYYGRNYNGYYWSSTIQQDNSIKAHCLYFNSSFQFTDESNATYQHSIRPVCSPK